MGISPDDGRLLVRAARKTVTELLGGGGAGPDPEFESRFSAKSGVFVTLNGPSGLRGCIGYPLPDRKLSFALRDASVSAATRDPRFPPLRPAELDGVTFEVTVLTPPERIAAGSPEERLAQIKVGRDGLIVTKGPYSGLLLPQVPAEYGWGEEEFLEHACQKAGLPKDCWKEPGTEVERFQGTVFREESPNGDVIEERP